MLVGAVAGGDTDIASAFGVGLAKDHFLKGRLGLHVHRLFVFVRPIM
jgi:hypothetical protein